MTCLLHHRVADVEESVGRMNRSEIPPPQPAERHFINSASKPAGKAIRETYPRNPNSERIYL
jgi:hypothetical protein